jgi:hypothetical protein
MSFLKRKLTHFSVGASGRAPPPPGQRAMGGAIPSRPMGGAIPPRAMGGMPPQQRAPHVAAAAPAKKSHTGLAVLGGFAAGVATTVAVEHVKHDWDREKHKLEGGMVPFMFPLPIYFSQTPFVSLASFVLL